MKKQVEAWIGFAEKDMLTVAEIIGNPNLTNVAISKTNVPAVCVRNDSGLLTPRPAWRIMKQWQSGKPRALRKDPRLQEKKFRGKSL
jgi:hypothetical protein